MKSNWTNSEHFIIVQSKISDGNIHFRNLAGLQLKIEMGKYHSFSSYSIFFEHDFDFSGFFCYFVNHLIVGVTYIEIGGVTSLFIFG
jgi:hypothetical protein